MIGMEIVTPPATLAAAASLPVTVTDDGDAFSAFYNEHCVSAPAWRGSSRMTVPRARTSRTRRSRWSFHDSHRWMTRLRISVESSSIALPSATVGRVANVYGSTS